ncbi:MAG: VWA domain-containing protein [Actinomycetota bacterium]
MTSVDANLGSPAEAQAMSVDGDSPVPQVSPLERRRRWRLVLGAAADDLDEPGGGDDSRKPGPAEEAERDTDTGPHTDADTGTDADADDDDDAGTGTGDVGDGDGGSSGDGLSGDDRRIDAALGALYDRDERAAGPDRRSGSRRGGLGRSRPGVVRWLGDIRRYFPTPVVRVLQRDAVERLDLRQLLLEPELLESVEPDLALVTVLVELNRVMPDETRATARQVIAQVLARIEERLADHTRQAVRGALARGAVTRRPRPGDIDWTRTIHANLRHWIPERSTLVPEQLLGHGRRQQSLARDVVIAVDQSGSMAESVVFASLFAGVLAQLPTLRTRFIAFDTSVTDLTPFLHDPVEVLFGVQLGGGTDIATALTYCQQQIERPRRSVLVLISDLFEGGNGDLMRQRVAELVVSGVRVIVLLALSDDGAPAHDHDHASALAALGARVLAATPDEFPDLLADALA